MSTTVPELEFLITKRLTLVFSQSTFAVKVILEKCNVGFGRILCGKELGICRFLERWSLHVLDDPLHSRYYGSVILNVLRKVDFRNDNLGLMRA